jgi:CHAT domain-containing protein
LSQMNKTPAADGFVTASEWPSYDLNSDLVFLSACETGLGKVIQGEGILGLPFALFVAGNTNTVITLWSILDDSTSVFVQRFFKKVKEGISESVALNQTKREFLLSKEHGRPVFWAPFVMYGY